MDKCTRGYIGITFFKGIHVNVKDRPSLLHSVEKKKIRTLSLGSQNDDETIIKLTFTAFVDIIVNV